VRQALIHGRLQHALDINHTYALENREVIAQYQYNSAYSVGAAGCKDVSAGLADQVKANTIDGQLMILLNPELVVQFYIKAKDDFQTQIMASMHETSRRKRDSRVCQLEIPAAFGRASRNHIQFLK